MSRAHDETIFASNFKAEPFWWEAAAPFRSERDLPQHIDVLIVGAGFCGLSAGITSVELGHPTVVIDAGPIGGMASSRSGALISSGQKMLISGAARKLEPESVNSVIQTHADAFDFLKGLAVDEGLDFNFQQCGRLFLASTPRDSIRFAEHAQLLRDRASVTVQLLDRGELSQEIGSEYYYGGMLVHEFGGIHPSKLALALANRFVRSGGLLSSHSRVTRVYTAGGGFNVDTSGGTLRAKKVLFATNGYTDAAFGYVKRRIAPAGSQIIATEPLTQGLMSEIMPRLRTYSDTKRSLWYFRPSPDGDRVLFGARPGAFPMSMERATHVVYRHLCRVFPQLEGVKITHSWSGNGGMTSNGLQQIGSNNGIYYAVGCNGSGATIMPYLGKMAAERMLGKRTAPTPFEGRSFMPFPPYREFPWFVPLAVAAYECRDRWDRIRIRW